MNTTPRRRILAAVAVAAVSATALAACGGTSTSSSTGSSGASGGTLNMALQGDITTFDPWSAQSGYNGSLWSNQALYDSLVHLDSKGDPQPWLATKWTSTDSSHYELTLRDDVKFSDGTALNADAVVKNIAYAQTATTPGECNAWLTGATATAKDATTVDITLATPNIGLMTDLGTCAGFIVNPTALTSPETLKTTAAGSGPYIIDSANSVQGSVWAYKRNPDYWAKASFPYDEIKLTYYKESTAADNAAKSGQIDLIQSIDASDTASGLKVLLTSTDFRGLMFLDVNGTINKPLGDVKVRQAMQYAIDRDAIVKAIYKNGSADVGYSTPFTTDATGWTDALKDTYTYDPAKAKQLLSDAGYPNGFEVDVLEVPSIYGDAAQAIAGQLAEVGITMKLSDHSSDFFQQLTGQTWAMTTFNYSIGTNPVHTYQGLVDPTGFWNVMKNQSPTISDLLTQLNAAADADAQKPVLEKIAQEFQTESWYLVPTLVRGASAYNDKKLSVDTVPGSPVPFLYMITPA